MTKQHNWIVQLCDHHAIRFDASYFAFRTIKEALKSKSSCLGCTLDMPENITKVDIITSEDL